MNSATTGLQVKTKHKSVSYDKYGYFFILPFFIVFLIFGLYPIIFTFRIALTDAVGWEMINENHVIGFQNFAQFFDPSSAVYPRFWGAFVNTLVIWIPNFVAQLGLALILASWFTDSRMHLKFQGGFKVMIFMPNIITAATVAMLFFSLFNYPVAPINTLMQSIGVLSAPFEFFRSVEWSRGIISFIQWWVWVGNTMIIMIAGISGINPSLFEAALVDGCTSRQTFWKITLPLIKPILVYNLVTSLVGGLTMFDIPQLMTQGNPNNTTDTVVRFIYNQGFTGSNNFNTASAASMILFVIIIIGSVIIKWALADHDPKPAKVKKGV